MQYYIVPKGIVDTYQNFQKGVYAIHFTQTNKGIWVINKNCGEDIFTEIPFSTFEIIELSPKDFEPTYENHPLVEGWRVVNVLDLYNNTIDITIWKNEVYQTFNKPYIDGTWTDEDVINYVIEWLQENNNS